MKWKNSLKDTHFSFFTQKKWVVWMLNKLNLNVPGLQENYIFDNMLIFTNLAFFQARVHTSVFMCIHMCTWEILHIFSVIKIIFKFYEMKMSAKWLRENLCPSELSCRQKISKDWIHGDTRNSMLLSVCRD